jgi:hypothetical protein
MLQDIALPARCIHMHVYDVVVYIHIGDRPMQLFLMLYLLDLYLITIWEENKWVYIYRILSLYSWQGNWFDFDLANVLILQTSFKWVWFRSDRNISPFHFPQGVPCGNECEVTTLVTELSLHRQKSNLDFTRWIIWTYVHPISRIFYFLRGPNSNLVWPAITWGKHNNNQKLLVVKYD